MACAMRGGCRHLSLLIFCAALALSLVVSASAADLVTVNVSAASPWSTDTGVSLAAGQSFWVVATGSWTSGLWTGGPEGQEGQLPTGNDWLLPGSRPYALIGKVGAAGAPFFIGAGGDFTASNSGNLILSMNDVPDVFWDNSGSLTVTIITGAPVAWFPIYDSSVANFSDWRTNHPDKCYWDEWAGAYHYTISDAADDYAFAAVPYQGGSFLLEFDVLPVTTAWAGNFRLGLWDDQMRQERPSCLYAHYHMDDNGHHASLECYWPGGANGITLGDYSDGQWYHTIIGYLPEARRAFFIIIRRADGQARGGTVENLGEFVGLDRIAMTSIGDSGYPGATAAGYINNVRLSVPGPLFSDVLADFWAYHEIQACVIAGIVKGYPDGTYHPQEVVTRDHMAVYIARALAAGDMYVPEGPPEPTFPDVPNTGYGPDGDQPHWAYKYVEYAVANGVVLGFDDGLYRPDEEVNRAQMAVYIARAIADPTGEEGLAGYLPPLIPTFPDVPNFGYGPDHTQPFWAYKHIEYIASRGIAHGYEDGLYHPAFPCSRDQMAVYIQRAFELPRY